MSLIISTLLHENTFGFALIIVGVVTILRWRHAHASAAILFFVAGWYATEIPLLSELTITKIEKFVAQGLISTCLIAVYMMGDVTKALLLACLNEFILILINILWLVLPLSAWWHWFLFGVINWISLIALCYNARITDYAGRGSESCSRPSEAGVNAYSRDGHGSIEVPAMALKEE